ncbi:MAG: tRNA CCA-pyrophosphorylase [Candidatus Thorarchaeota archaeon]|nr:MAG: tRNA CCA-pyrophosphorylase [Candidatus Thorarchaeota archaeon]
MQLENANGLGEVLKMSAVGVDVLLTSGRTLKQGRGMEIGKLSSDYFDAVSICEMDESTLKVLGIEDGDPVRVETDIGSVVVFGKHDRRAEPGVVFIPCGPYANAVTGSDTLESGMPGYKSIPARVFPAKGETVPTVEEILAEMVGVG